MFNLINFNQRILRNLPIHPQLEFKFIHLEWAILQIHQNYHHFIFREIIFRFNLNYIMLHRINQTPLLLIRVILLEFHFLIMVNLSFIH